MRKQRWRFTKYSPRDLEFLLECSGCGDKLDRRDSYSRRYGFCSVGCGMTTYGLSWSDFY